jgi:hypothetical protein
VAAAKGYVLHKEDLEPTDGDDDGINVSGDGGGKGGSGGGRANVHGIPVFSVVWIWFENNWQIMALFVAGALLTASFVLLAYAGYVDYLEEREELERRHREQFHSGSSHSQSGLSSDGVSSRTSLISSGAASSASGSSSQSKQPHAVYTTPQFHPTVHTRLEHQRTTSGDEGAGYYQGSTSYGTSSINVTTQTTPSVDSPGGRDGDQRSDRDEEGGVGVEMKSINNRSTHARSGGGYVAIPQDSNGRSV